MKQTHRFYLQSADSRNAMLQRSVSATTSDKRVLTRTYIAAAGMLPEIIVIALRHSALAMHAQ
jgi:hypothetical protein